MDKNLLLVLILVPSILLVVVVLILIYTSIHRKNKIRKEFRSLDKIFQYYHAILVGQDSQYVKRLEIISRTNLLYVEIHTQFLKRFKEIRDKQDAKAQNSINKLADMISDHHFNQARKYYPDVKALVDAFEESVKSLNNDLLGVVKPEEDCRQASLTLKEQYRRLKQDYYAKQSDLVMLANSFEKVFGLIDSKFDEFESLVESAEYIEANNLLPKIEGILNELSSSLKNLPSLCILVSDVLPTRLGELEVAYHNLLNEGYPLHHLGLDKNIEILRNRVEEAKNKLRQFAIHNLENELEEMLAEIDAYFKKFEEEKEAKGLFDEQNEQVYTNVNLIERRFIRLCNIIPEVSRIYVINDAHKVKVNTLQTDINKVGALKRSLDTFIHSAIKQPYSQLIVKMNELKDASDSVILELDEFDSYLDSLKIDSEESFKLIFTFFDRIKRAEKEVREINIIRVTEKYEKDFDRCYELLNNINSLLKKLPINVDEVNKNVSELYDVSNDILEGGSIDQEHNMMVLAENAIMHANKGRSHLSDIDQLVAQAETFFKEGDFEQSYIIAGNALKKIRAYNEKQQ